MRGSPFVPFFFARLLRAHNGKRVGQSRSIEQVRVFQTTKKKTEICNPKFNTIIFFFLLLLHTYKVLTLHINKDCFDHGASLFAACSKKTQSVVTLLE